MPLLCNFQRKIYVSYHELLNSTFASFGINLPLQDTAKGAGSEAKAVKSIDATSDNDL